jgi:hypothetical protein
MRVYPYRLIKQRGKMIKNTIFIGLAGLSLMACGGGSAPNTSNANATQANTVNAAANTTNTSNASNNANTANTSANKPANTTANAAAAKPAESGPKRIAFAQGKSEGEESISLAAGEAKQFVVSAKTAQIFVADAESKDVTISMVKGKIAKDATKSEPGYFDTTLLENGDFVFEVKNTSKKEVKTKVKVIIDNTAHSK